MTEENKQDRISKMLQLNSLIAEFLLYFDIQDGIKLNVTC